MSRAVRMGIGLVALIPVMAIAVGGFLALGVEGATVGWLALGVGMVWFFVVAWWALRAPERPGNDDRAWGVFRHDRFR